MMEREMKRAFAAVWVALAAGTLAATPRIVDMSLKGGARGLMLVVTTDGECPADVTTQVMSLSPTTARVTVTIRGVGYGLGVHRFTEMPDGGPVSEIGVRVQEGYETVEIAALLHVPSVADVSTKVKGRDLLVLLSSERMSSLGWRASDNQKPGVRMRETSVSSPTPVTIESPGPRAALPEQAVAAAKTGVQAELVCLRDIIIVERGGLAQMHLALSGEVRPRVRCENGRVIALFPGVANCLGEYRLDPPVGRVFRSIELRQRTHNGVEWLGVIVTVGSEGRAPVLVNLEPGRTSLSLAVGDDGYAVWSARAGQFASAIFACQAAVSGGGKGATAPVSVTPADSESSVSPVPEQVVGYYVVAGSKVNVRSRPTTEERNIVGTVPRGATVGVVEVQGDWRRVKAEGVEGWVLGSLLTPQSAAVEAPEAVVPTAASRTVKAATMLPSIGAIASMTALGQNAPPSGPASAAPAAVPPQAQQIAGSSSRGTLQRAASVDSVAALPAGMVQYAVFGRDPFIPHVRRIDDALPNVENLKLVGVLYDRTDRIALLQDELFREKSYALREQEPVNNGVVWRINPSSVVFLITELGVSRAYTLELGEVSPTKVQAKRGR